jgi:hypothetical protein
MAVVGASFASFGAYILAAVCIVVAAIQPVGWIGVLRVCRSWPDRPCALRWFLADPQEKTSTFKAYAWANALAVAAAFSVAAALIITSAVRHDTAVADCKVGLMCSRSRMTLPHGLEPMRRAVSYADFRPTSTPLPPTAPRPSSLPHQTRR